MMKENIYEWQLNHIPYETTRYRDCLEEQIMFVNYSLGNLFSTVIGKQRKQAYYFLSVIGEYISMHVRLPVMELEVPKLGLKFVLRCNMHDWCISIESDNEVHCDFLDLDLKHQGHFEGFPVDRIYEFYSPWNSKTFSVCLRGRYEVYMFVRILKHWAVNNVLNKENQND